MVKIRPLNGKIFVTLLEEKEEGIILPDSVEKEQVRGKVIAVAPGIDPDIKKGKIINFIKSAFNKIIIEEKEYYYLTEEDVLAIE